MKVCVTGATGHIGINVCMELLGRGHTVTALVPNSWKPIDDLPVAIVKGNVLDGDSLRILMKGSEAVMHLAGIIGLGYKFDQTVFDVNVTGTKNVLDVSRELGMKKVVHFSSIHVFEQQPQDIPMDESRSFVTNERSVFYDQTKRDGHLMAQQAAGEGLDVSIVCPTGVLGPYDYRPSRLGKAVIDIYEGFVPTAVKGGFDFVDVRDVASGAVSALEKGKKGETYILGGKYYSIKELGDMILKVRDSEKELGEIPLSLAYVGLPFVNFYAWITGKQPLYNKVYLDVLKSGNKKVLSSKAEKELGYTSRNMEITVRDTLNWFRNHKMI